MLSRHTRSWIWATLLPFLGACGGLSLRGSPEAGSAVGSATSSADQSTLSADALARDAALLDMTALAYAQEMLGEVNDKIGDSSVIIRSYEFRDISSLYDDLVGSLEAIGDQRTIREQLEDLGLDPNEHEEPSDADIDEVLGALEADIFASKVMSLGSFKLAAAPVNPNQPQEEEKQLQAALQNFGQAYEQFKGKVSDYLNDLKESKEDFNGVQFSSGCFSMMWQGDVCRSRSLYSTSHAFGGDAVFGFCFLNGSQQVSHPSGSGFRCLITY